MAKKDINVTSVNVTNATNSLNNLGKQANNTSNNLNNLNNNVNKLNQNLNNSGTSTSKFSASIGKVGNSINSFGGSIGKSINSLRGFNSVLGSAFKWFGAYKLVDMFFGVISNGLQSIMGFSSEMSRLAAITGDTREGLKALEEQAIQLGASSVYTAKQVVALQIELAKLGFTQREILASTKAVSEGATAMGTSTANAATLAGTTLRAFGLNAEEMDRVVGVLAKSTTKSALSFEYLNTALPYVSSSASAMNISLEETVSMMALLADSGIKASTAGTSLRNIFTKIADESKKLGLALGPIRNFDDMLIAFKELSASGLDVAKAFELTDARALNAILVMAKQTDKLGELREALGDTNGVLAEMSEKQLDNLQGSITKLLSAWDSLILGFRNSEGILKGAVDGLTAIINLMGSSPTKEAKDLLNEFKGADMANIDKTIAIRLQYDLAPYKQSLTELNTAYNANLEERKRLQLAFYKSTDSLEKSNIQQKIQNLKSEGDIIVNKIKDNNKIIEDITYKHTESVLKSSSEYAAKRQEQLAAEIKAKRDMYDSGIATMTEPQQAQLLLLEGELESVTAIVNRYNNFISDNQKKRQDSEEKWLAEQKRINDERVKDAEKTAKKLEEVRKKELEVANNIQAKAIEANLTDLQKVEQKYQTEKALLEKFGLDSTVLTANYLRQREELINKSIMSETDIINNNYNIQLNTLNTNLTAQLITQDQYNKALEQLTIQHQTNLTNIQKSEMAKRSQATQAMLDKMYTEGTEGVLGMDAINTLYEEGMLKLDELDLKRRWGVLGEKMYNNELLKLQLEQIQGTMAVVDAQIAALEAKKDLTDQELAMLRKAQKERNKLQRQEGKLKKEGGKDWEGWASAASAATAAVGGAMQDFAQLAKEDSKAQKALAITGVTMETISGGISAVAGGIQQFGPVLGPIIGGTTAAGLLASGIVAIKNIKSAENGLEGGDVVPPVGPSPEAVAPPPISFTRNILGQEDIALQKEIANGQVVEVSIIDIEKAQSSYRAKVKESKF